jgi:hypothetical protein
MDGREMDKGVGGKERSGGGSRRMFSFSCLPCRRLSRDGFEDFSASKKDAPVDEGPKDGN